MEPALLALLASAALQGGALVPPAGIDTTSVGELSFEGSGVDADRDPASRVARYAAAGSVLGSLVGTAVGYWLFTEESCADPGFGTEVSVMAWGACRTERQPMRGALIGGAAGAGVGALIGLREDRTARDSGVDN